MTGGHAADGTFKSDVFVATINSDGTLGAWSAIISLPNGVAAHASVAYNGYLYVLGGAKDSTGPTNQLFIAPINADGTIGAWTSHALGRIVYHHAGFAYNGQMYLIGGENNGGQSITDVSYQTINSDGTLNSGFNAANVLPAGRRDLTAVAYGGSLYVTNGYSTDSSAASTEVDCATIRADGSVGPWNQTAPSSANGTLSARSGQGGAVYNGKIYVFGGANGSTYLNDVQVAPLVNGGTLGPTWSGATSFTTARQQSVSVAYNRRIYVIGGNGAGGRLSDVQFIPVKDDGTFPNSWTTTTAFPTARSGHTAIAYNGFLYVIGGQSASAVLNDVQFAPISSNGTIGTWTATSSFTTARRAHTSVLYNGNLYIIGGLNSAGARLSDVQVASINNSNGTLGTWQTTTALPAGLSESAGVAYSGYLYMIGGIDNTGSPTGNLMAPINTNGTIGAWTATTSPTTPTYEDTAVVDNGYLYVLGGTNSSGSASAFMGYAPINANGTLGTWTATTSLTPARFEHASVAYNDKVYVIGGVNSAGTLLNDVQLASLNVGGQMGDWVDPGTFTTSRFAQSSVAYNGFLYILGGESTSAALNDVQVSSFVSGSGYPAGFNTTTSFTTARFAHSSVAYNGFIYVIGGSQLNGTALNDVQVAPINSNGTVGTWTTTTAFPNPRFYHSSVVSNGHLYVIGGVLQGGAATNDVEEAPINANGTVGAWTATSALGTARFGVSSVAYNGYVYAIAGFTGSADLASVEMAPVNSNGTLGAWTQTSWLSRVRDLSTSVVQNGYIYVIGGEVGGTPFLNEVEVAPINSNGTLGSWVTTTTAPGSDIGGNVANRLHSSVAYNGYIYRIGGASSRSPLTVQNDISVAALYTPSAQASYSKLIDLGADAASMDSITVNGLASNLGTVSLQYRTAADTGVFGAVTNKGVITLGSPIALGPTSVRYLWLRFQLDDSNTTVVNPDATNQRDITDFTLSYTSGLAVTINAAPTSYVTGGSSTLTWSSTAATSCTASGSWTGTEALGGSLIVSPTVPGTYTYTLTCSNGGGSTSSAATVTVLDQCNGKADNTACTDDGNVCTTDICSAGICTHPAGNSGTECRASTGVSDPHEVCDGVSTTCPADSKAPNGATCTDDGNPCTTDLCESGSCTHSAGNAGTVCRSSAGVCDPAETCDGVTTTCPADAKTPAGTECRASTGECDPHEVCDGVSNSCPADTKSPAGTVCTDDGNPCTVDQCNGTSVTCQHTVGNAGTVCRPAAGDCDIAEVCSGTSATCPVDAKVPAGTACTDDHNSCTLDQCDGTDVTCQHKPIGHRGVQKGG